MSYERCADELDNAAAESQREVDRGIQRAKDAMRNRGGLSPKGNCWNCTEPFSAEQAPSRLFCDADCRDDHERIAVNRLGMVR